MQVLVVAAAAVACLLGPGLPACLLVCLPVIAIMPYFIYHCGLYLFCIMDIICDGYVLQGTIEHVLVLVYVSMYRICVVLRSCSVCASVAF